ncbi:MAG: hypothetical protein IPN15_16375 [Saprospiraceae bacterium]|nr:hypothetical protein [Candidatus Vicinibacter affinis]
MVIELKERIGKELYDQLGNRDSLLNYYKVWREKNSNPKTVVLIAGSGGGSRAGYWTGINLDHIYATLGDTAKIFAISTIRQYFRSEYVFNPSGC